MTGSTCTRALILLAALAAASSHLTGQPEPSGLIAGAAYARTTISLAGAPFVARNALLLDAGIRVCPYCWAGWRRLRVRPHIAYLVTSFGGIDTSAINDVSFSHIDRGVDVSYRVAHHLRMVATYRIGKRTAERMEPGGLTNYAGGGHGVGATLEIPLTPELGRGLEIGYSSLSGRFDTRERLGKSVTTALDYRTRVWFIGWSGTFTGTDWPWR